MALTQELGLYILRNVKLWEAFFELVLWNECPRGVVKWMPPLKRLAVFSEFPSPAWCNLGWDGSRREGQSKCSLIHYACRILIGILSYYSFSPWLPTKLHKPQALYYFLKTSRRKCSTFGNLCCSSNENVFIQMPHNKNLPSMAISLTKIR